VGALGLFSSDGRRAPVSDGPSAFPGLFRTGVRAGLEAGPELHGSAPRSRELRGRLWTLLSPAITHRGSPDFAFSVCLRACRRAAFPCVGMPAGIVSSPCQLVRLSRVGRPLFVAEVVRTLTPRLGRFSLASPVVLPGCVYYRRTRSPVRGAQEAWGPCEVRAVAPSLRATRERRIRRADDLSLG